MRHHSRRAIAVAITGIGLLASVLMWTLTNDYVSECSSDLGVFAQAVNNQASNDCQAASIIHSLGLIGMVSMLIVLAIAAIYQISQARKGY